MIAEIGNFALVLAFVLALVQTTLPLAGAQRGNPRWMQVAGPAALGQFGFIVVAFACLTHAFVVSDFSVANVAANSHSAKPMLYKIAGVWGNHEGSMVLWVLILAFFGGLIALYGTRLPLSLRARVLAIQGLIGAAFLAFILFTSNPFDRVIPPPLDGNGLNPLLQDPGLAFHPPFLYLGYVGFSTAFSFAVAALIEGRVDPAWARWVRPWTLLAWSALTLGIAMGSWWAYYELGWGGWWFWDPVENASFMPWLAGTALLHSAIVVEKREALKTWTILLAILTFSLSLMGTFLVRSGVLTSVHAFATDPTRGSFILAIMVAAIGGSLALFAARAPALKTQGLFHPISREGGLILNNLLLATATATVFLGTLYPLLLDAMDGPKVSVGAPYFNATFLPIMMPLVVAVAIGPMLSWKRADLLGALSRLKFAALGALVAMLATWYAVTAGPVLAVLAIGIAIWLLLGVATDLAERVALGRVPIADSLRRARLLPRATWGMAIAHGALAIAIIGMTGHAWQIEDIRAIRPGDRLDIGGYTLILQSVGPAPGPNYRAERGAVTVERSGRLVTTLFPEKRFYENPVMETTEAAIHTTGLADLYVVLGERNAEAGTWTLRTYLNPFAPWIWAGAVFMVLGGIVSLTDRRYRVGAPHRSASRAVPESVAAE